MTTYFVGPRRCVSDHHCAAFGAEDGAIGIIDTRQSGEPPLLFAHETFSALVAAGISGRLDLATVPGNQFTFA